MIWAVISTPLLNMLREEGCTVYFRTALQGDVLSFVGYAFVDDTDLIVSGSEPTASFQDIISRMQQSLDLWEGGLRATGGAIVPEKSHWYLIDFKWEQGRWSYVTESDAPGEISVRDFEGNEKQLLRLEAHQARRTLGVRLAPDGYNKTELEYLLQQATIWADQAG